MSFSVAALLMRGLQVFTPCTVLVSPCSLQYPTPLRKVAACAANEQHALYVLRRPMRDSITQAGIASTVCS